MEYTAAAKKALNALDKRIKAQVEAKIEMFARDPKAIAGSIKRLTGSPFVRLRVGDYSVVIDEQRMVVIVVNVGYRRDIYR